MRSARLLWLVLLLVAPAARAANPYRVTYSSTIGERAVKIAERQVGTGPPVRAASRWRELRVAESWGQNHPKGQCVAFTSSVLADAGARVGRLLYVNHLEAQLQRARFRAVSLREAPAGSVVAIYSQDQSYRLPLHYGILAGPVDDGIEMYESGFPDGDVTRDHVLQLARHDGTQWAGAPTRTFFLAPPDTVQLVRRSED